MSTPPSPGGYQPQLIGANSNCWIARIDGLPEANAPGSVPVWDGSKWVAKAPAPPRPRVLRPFVLKCPQCMAPTESGSTSCDYCQVPLTWEPIESLGRDDRGYRSKESEAIVEDDDSRSILAFSKAVLCGMSTMTFETKAMVPLRPTHLYVPPEFAKDFVVADFRVGQVSQRDTLNPIPASIFSIGRGMPVDCDTVLPGIRVALVIENHSYESRTFHAIARCRKLV